MKKSMVMQVIKGVIAAYVISAIILLVLAFLMYQWDVSEGIIRAGIVLTYLFSCFTSGMITSKNQSGPKYIWGILAGTLYYVILFVISLICNQAMSVSVPSLVPVLLYCILGGMLGGMFQAGRK